MLTLLSPVSVLQLLGIVSVVMFVGSLVLIPWLILRLDAEYFLFHKQSPTDLSKRHPVLQVIILTVRNCMGLLLISAGIAMIFLPGQGILTLLVGLSVMTFPGKHWLLEQALQLHKVRQSLNWIRSKGDKPLFIFPDQKSDDNA